MRLRNCFRCADAPKTRTLAGMSNSPPTSIIADLKRLILADGLPAETQSGGQRRELHYRVVILRETSVADERWAVQQAERVMLINGQHKLLVSEHEFRLALTLRHCERFEADTQQLDQNVLSLELLGKLSTHDLALIEERVFLIELAAQVRYGQLSQADFEAVVQARNSGAAKVQPAPQPVGQTTELGADGAQLESGPAMLADFTGANAQSKARGARR